MADVHRPSNHLLRQQQASLLAEERTAVFLRCVRREVGRRILDHGLWGKLESSDLGEVSYILIAMLTVSSYLSHHNDSRHILVEEGDREQLPSFLPSCRQVDISERHYLCISTAAVVYSNEVLVFDIPSHLLLLFLPLIATHLKYRCDSLFFCLCLFHSQRAI